MFCLNCETNITKELHDKSGIGKNLSKISNTYRQIQYIKSQNTETLTLLSLKNTS